MDELVQSKIAEAEQGKAEAQARFDATKSEIQEQGNWSLYEKDFEEDDEDEEA